MNRTTLRLSGQQDHFVPDGRRRMFWTFGPPPQAGTINVVAVEPQHREPKSNRGPIRNSRMGPYLWGMEIMSRRPSHRFGRRPTRYSGTDFCTVLQVVAARAGPPAGPPADPTKGCP